MQEQIETRPAPEETGASSVEGVLFTGLWRAYRDLQHLTGGVDVIRRNEGLSIGGRDLHDACRSVFSKKPRTAGIVIIAAEAAPKCSSDDQRVRSTYTGRGPGSGKVKKARSVQSASTPLGPVGMASLARAASAVRERAAATALSFDPAPHARTLSEAFARGLDTMRDARPGLTGRLRVSAPMRLAAPAFARVVTGFAMADPGISLDIDLDDRSIDPAAAQVDLALRFGDPGNDPRLARRPFTTRGVICCAPESARRVTHPQQLADLTWVR